MLLRLLTVGTQNNDLKGLLIIKKICKKIKKASSNIS